MAELMVRSGLLPIGPDRMFLEWAVGSAPAQGESCSGDRHLVVATDGGALVTVLDALGHGESASEVADVALQELRSVVSRELGDVLIACHRRLRGTRGVVATLASYDDAACLSWLGVGNVSAVLWRSAYGRLRLQAEARTHPGIIGLKLPPLTAVSNRLKSGDVLVIATDGIAVDAPSNFAAADSAQTIAQTLVEEHKIASDDGIALVARYLERRHE